MSNDQQVVADQQAVNNMRLRSLDLDAAAKCRAARNATSLQAPREWNIHPEGGRERGRRRLRNASEETCDFEHGMVELAADSFITPDHPNYKNTRAYLDSYETLIKIGFTAKAASNIFEKWDSVKDQDKSTDTNRGLVDFAGIIRAHVLSKCDNTRSDDDKTWVTTLEKAGIAPSLRTAIMTPEFRKIRLTKSCHYWVMASVLQRYKAIEEAQVKSHDSSNYVLERSMSDAARENRATLNLTKSMADFAKEANESSDLLFLYHCEHAVYRADRMYTHNGVAMTVTQGHSSVDAALYTVDNFETICQYARFIHKCAPNSNIKIVRIQIPKAAILNIKKRVTIDNRSEEEQGITFASLDAISMREESSKGLKSFLIITGAYCGEDPIERGSPEANSSLVLSEQEGGVANSYIFMRRKGQEFLFKHAVGYIAPFEELPSQGSSIMSRVVGPLFSKLSIW